MPKTLIFTKHGPEADRILEAFAQRTGLPGSDGDDRRIFQLEGEAYTVHEEINLGIAVSLGEEGLIVPVIQDAQDLSAEGLAKRIKDIARRARSKELVPDEVRGGTFTITNPGQYGSIMATPVINQPQVAILDLEAVVKRPVVVTDADGDDAIAVRPMCILGLSWDHRALDGALAAQFLGALRDRLQRL